ncbi:unnamed protein product [Trifolium pratense]|uniref:Uncharacterized protein n=1 Tax=Trifolium pratense TaxID=57577 RepID=A0ACB0LU71_TRIPR|nr:unnamed protein product [Trifolium pratense]
MNLSQDNTAWICLAVWLILFLMIADFFNWNRVKIRYCDGASFTGDSEDRAAQLQFRGQHIWLAAIEDLMSKGMRFAKQVQPQGNYCNMRLEPSVVSFISFGVQFFLSYMHAKAKGLLENMREILDWFGKWQRIA